MDSDAKEVLKTGLTVVLRPVTEIAENALGILGGDYLSEARKRNRARLAQKTEELLKGRRVEPDRDVSPSVMIPILSAAQDESREELVDIYSKLAAAAADPKRRGSVRREFIDIAKQLEPLDVAVLQKIESAGGTQHPPTRAVAFAQQLQVPTDHVITAMAALLQLGLTDEKAGVTSPQSFPILSPKGRQFMAAIAP